MASMTQHTQVVESPFAQRSVQLTLVAIALLVFTWFTIAFRHPSPLQPRGADRVTVMHVNDRERPMSLRIEINSAPARELSLLPGVGPVLANRIVKNRRLHGRFSSLQDLSRVHGIGPKKLLEVSSICVVDVSADVPADVAVDSDDRPERLALGRELK